MNNLPRDANGNFLAPEEYGTGGGALRTYECAMGTRTSKTASLEARMVCRPAPYGCSQVDGMQCLTVYGDPPVALSDTLTFDMVSPPGGLAMPGQHGGTHKHNH